MEKQLFSISELPLNQNNTSCLAACPALQHLLTIRVNWYSSQMLGSDSLRFAKTKQNNTLAFVRHLIAYFTV